MSGDRTGLSADAHTFLSVCWTKRLAQVGCMDDTRPPEQRDALAHRVLQEWIAANARQQSLVHHHL